jgi:hypothetical protein
MVAEKGAAPPDQVRNCKMELLQEQLPHYILAPAWVLFHSSAAGSSQFKHALVVVVSFAHVF